MIVRFFLFSAMLVFGEFFVLSVTKWGKTTNEKSQPIDFQLIDF